MSTAVPAPPATGPGGPLGNLPVARRLDQRLDATGRAEVARMAGALNTALNRLTSALGGIDASATTPASSFEELTAVAGRMTSSAGRSATPARAGSSVSGRIGRHIAAVFAGAEEVGGSIAEIARGTASATQVAGRAGHMGAVADGSHKISRDVAVVAEAAAAATGAAAEELAWIAHDLRNSLSMFRY
jgi:methyl-accepting chemotaxis protein